MIAFCLAFLLSFVGSIPPGTLNLTILDLGLKNRMESAWRFAIAAGLVEYPYAWAAIYFEKQISNSPALQDNMAWIASTVMVILGLWNIRSSRKVIEKQSEVSRSGFRKGILLSILNPLALPYWLGVTAYLRSQGWIRLDGVAELHMYLSGISLGAIVLLIGVAYLARLIQSRFSQIAFLSKFPGFTLLFLGLYGWIKLIF